MYTCDGLTEWNINYTSINMLKMKKKLKLCSCAPPPEIQRSMIEFTNSVFIKNLVSLLRTSIEARCSKLYPGIKLDHQKAAFAWITSEVISLSCCHKRMLPAGNAMRLL